MISRHKTGRRAAAMAVVLLLSLGSACAEPPQTFVFAIGQGPNPVLSNVTPGLETDKWGCIIVNDETQMSSLPGVFSGGDVTVGATVITAMGDGRNAATGIDDYLTKQREEKEAATAG